MRKLYDVISICCRELGESGRYVTISEVRELLVTRFPEVIAEFAVSLQAIGLSRVLEARVKKSRPKPIDEEPGLFGEEWRGVGEHLPGMISIPRRQRTLSETDRDSDIDWKATLDARYIDLRLHLEFLEECISKDQRSFEKMQLFFFRIEPEMRNNPDLTVRDVLKRYAGQRLALPELTGAE